MQLAPAKLSTLIGFFFICFLSTAHSADQDQPINITADSMVSQEKSGKSVYKGSVVVTQGSMTLKGDVINVLHPKGKLNKLVATGQQASFQRFSEKDQAWLKGRADKIEYHANNKTILLIGNAKAEQPGKHVITGPKLFYDIQKKTLQAQSTSTEKRRISVTFTPATEK